MKQAATSRSARRRNFLGFGGSKKSSSAGMGGARRDAYNRGFSGQSEVAFDKWLARQSYTKHSLLHHSSVSVKDLRRAYQDGQRDLFEKKGLVEREKLDKYKRRQEERAEAAKEREKIRREKAEERAQARHELAAEREKIRQQKAELAELRAHKHDEKAPPIPEGEKASDQNLEYKGHLIKRTTTGWEVLGESGWGSLSDAKQYVDLYVMTSGKVKRKNACKPSAKARFKVARKTAEKRVTAAARALQGKRNPGSASTVSYKKHFLTGNLKGLTVDGSFDIPYAVNDPEVTNYMATLRQHTKAHPGKDAGTRDEFWVSDIRVSHKSGPTRTWNAGKKSIRKSKKEARKRMGLKNPTATLKQGDSVAHVVEMGTNSYSAQVTKKGGERESRDFKGRGAFNAAMSWARLRLHEVANPCSYRLFKEKPKGRRNPEDASVRMYEKFHGIPSEEVREYIEEEHRHSWLAGLGPLISMVVMNVQGNKDVLLEFPDPLDDDATEVVMLCVTEDGNQLICVGGDQELPEKFLIEKFGMTPTDFNRDNALIGTIKQITYRTKKKFEKDGTEEIDFFHDLGGEGSRGVYPVLEYKTRSPRCVIVGGRYYVGKYESSIGASPGVIG